MTMVVLVCLCPAPRGGLWWCGGVDVAHTDILVVVVQVQAGKRQQAAAGCRVPTTSKRWDWDESSWPLAAGMQCTSPYFFSFLT